MNQAAIPRHQHTHAEQTTELGWPMLLMLCLLPWVWVATGLYWLENFIITATFYQLGACLIPYLVFGEKRPQFHPTKWSPSFMLTLLLLITICTAALIFMWEHIYFKTDDPTLDHCFLCFSGFKYDAFTYFYQSISFSPQRDYWFFALFFVLINPVVEELFWRGFILQQFKIRMSTTKAILLSSIFFGAWHWLLIFKFYEPSIALLLAGIIMLAGICFALLYERSKGLLPAILVHSLGADLPIMFILLNIFTRLDVI